MKRLTCNDTTWYNLYQQEDGNILKISTIPTQVWEKFCNKQLKFVNTPTSYHKISKQDERTYKIGHGIIRKKSIITLPFLTGYTTLKNTIFDDSFTTTQILELLKKSLGIIEYLHQNQVTHNDIHSNNIMINKNLDLQFIDFDAMTIDDYISEENVYHDDDISDEEKIQESINQDKLDILITYFSYLCSGDFKSTDVFYKFLEPRNQSRLGLKKEHMRALVDFFASDEIKPDYYYTDFIDDLISENYQAPLIYKKNIKHQ